MKSKHNILIKKIINDKRYAVHPDGKIYKRCGTRWRKCKTTTHNGYARICYENTLLRVHRIVYAAYGKGRLELTKTINHKDGNKLNNSIDNLEQVTQKENVRHAFAMGFHKRKRKISEKIQNKNKNNNVKKSITVFTLQSYFNKNNHNKTSLINNLVERSQGEARLAH